MKIIREYITLYVILALYSFCQKEGAPIDYDCENHQLINNAELPEYLLN